MTTPMAVPVLETQAERNHALDWMKWLALVSMVLDHVWFVLPADWLSHCSVWPLQPMLPASLQDTRATWVACCYSQS